MAIDGVRAVVETTEDAPTGLALITVDSFGENSIIVVPGANQLAGVSRAAQQAIAMADVVLSQLEIPTTTVLEAARNKRTGALFMLNAAPVVPVPEELWALVDVLIVNEHEAAEIAATDLGNIDKCVEALLILVPDVVITLGEAGCLYASRKSKQIRLSAPRVKAIDTTAAGDTFCGVFAAEIARGQDPERAMQIACAAAAVTVQRVGAQVSIPTQKDTLAVSKEFYGTS
jgi:ribokinase